MNAALSIIFALATIVSISNCIPVISLDQTNELFRADDDGEPSKTDVPAVPEVTTSMPKTTKATDEEEGDEEGATVVEQGEESGENEESSSSSSSESDESDESDEDEESDESSESDESGENEENEESEEAPKKTSPKVNLPPKATDMKEEKVLSKGVKKPL